jgi:hypothetical protein
MFFFKVFFYYPDNLNYCDGGGNKYALTFEPQFEPAYLQLKAANYNFEFVGLGVIL